MLLARSRLSQPPQPSGWTFAWERGEYGHRVAHQRDAGHLRPPRPRGPASDHAHRVGKPGSIVATVATTTAATAATTAATATTTAATATTVFAAA